MIIAITGVNSQAFSGKLQKYSQINRTPNWKSSQPKVVIAFGLLEKKLVKHYNEKYTKGKKHKYTTTKNYTSDKNTTNA